MIFFRVFSDSRQALLARFNNSLFGAYRPQMSRNLIALLALFCCVAAKENLAPDASLVRAHCFCNISRPPLPPGSLAELTE